MSFFERLGRAIRGEPFMTLGDCVRTLYGHGTPDERWRAYDAIHATGAGVLLQAAAARETLLIDTKDNNISRSVFVTGDYQYATMIEVLARLSEGRGGPAPDTLIDIGANIGVICIPAVARGHFARAVAIEPTPSVCRLLRANIALNGLEKAIEVRETALSNVQGEIAFETCDDNPGDNRVSVVSDKNAYGESARSKISVPVTTFDSLPCDIDPARTLVWIDVQGFEGFVLAGAKRLVSNRTPLVLEFWPYGLARAKSYELLQAALAGYEKFCVLGQAGGWRPVSEIDALFESHANSTAHDDILVI